QARLQAVREARQNQVAAGAKLVQLLRLEPGTRLVAADPVPLPVSLVDETLPTRFYLDHALRQGPGMNEVLLILASLEEQTEKLKTAALLPNMSVDLGQGTFGGGTGGRNTDYNGRTDLELNVYWDVTDLLGARAQKSLLSSKKRQVMLQREQIAGRLATGVVVAHTNAREAKARLKLAEEEIADAIESYNLSRQRLLNAETLSIEVMQAIGSLGTARGNYLSAVRDFNRAQIQLRYLIGFGLTEGCASVEEIVAASRANAATAEIVVDADATPAENLAAPTVVPATGALPDQKDAAVEQTGAVLPADSDAASVAVDGAVSATEIVQAAAVEIHAPTAACRPKHHAPLPCYMQNLGRSAACAGGTTPPRPLPVGASALGETAVTIGEQTGETIDHSTTPAYDYRRLEQDGLPPSMKPAAPAVKPTAPPIPAPKVEPTSSLPTPAILKWAFRGATPPAAKPVAAKPKVHVAAKPPAPPQPVATVEHREATQVHAAPAPAAPTKAPARRRGLFQR
ncbi:MAG: TolC family protein, partial [Planctomycetia bacterium]